MALTLVTANRVHSSWSLRPWLLLKAFGIPFEDVVIPFGPTFDDPAWKAKVRAYAPSGKVPALRDGNVAVWDSLSIVEYVAERRPDLAIWPRDLAARAHARSVSAEMHSGFSALRSACPMHLGKIFAPRDRGPAVAADVARIEAIWAEARSRFGAPSGAGPYLYGAFSAADAMFAPVCTRFRSYSVEVGEGARAYMDAIYAHPAFREWHEAALAEPWLVPEDEPADEATLADHRAERGVNVRLHPGH